MMAEVVRFCLEGALLCVVGLGIAFVIEFFVERSGER